MSRCFQYPPPGYILSEEKKEALIELIKLQKEREMMEEKKREKKERRMEKKQKREEKKKEREEKKKKREEMKERSKEKKDKTSHKVNKSDVVNCHERMNAETKQSQQSGLTEKKEREEKKKKRVEKKKEREEMKERSKEKKDETSQKVNKSDIVNCHERMNAETEQSQQSDLTEEHGHLDSVPVPSSSHDSTENSNKRKRQSSPVECSHGHDKANLIRKASKGQSVIHSLAKGRQHTDDCCYTSGRTSSREQICSTSGKTGNRSSLNAVMHGVELQYKHLFESWFPPQLHDASLYPVDSDWLYPDRRNQDTQRAEKTQRSGCDSISCSRSSTSWHRAEYLPEIDAFALPYVVPY